MDFEIVPGQSLGPFVLGMPLQDVVSIIIRQSSKMTVPTLIFNSEDPLSQDIVIEVKDSFLRFFFDSKTQRMKFIEITSLSALSLSYSNIPIKTSQVRPELMLISNTFGPTLPGNYDSQKNLYYHNYPGITFLFEIDQKYVAEFHSDVPPISFSDGNCPVVSQIFLFYGFQTGSLQTSLSSLSSSSTNTSQTTSSTTTTTTSSSSSSSSSSLSVSTQSLPTSGSLTSWSLATISQSPPLPSNSHYFELITVKLGSGLFFHKRKRGKTIVDSEGERERDERGRVIFGSSIQEVLSLLGPPNRIYEKGWDRMRIHQSKSSTPSLNDNSHYGQQNHLETFQFDDFDSLDEPKHQHQNQNEHEVDDSHSCDYFYNYFSFGFDILFDHQTHTVKKFILHTNFPTHIDFWMYTRCNFRVYKKGSEDNPSAEYFTPISQLPSVEKVLGTSLSKPAVFHRSEIQHFRTTWYYGWPNIAVEIMENKHIASICLFP